MQEKPLYEGIPGEEVRIVYDLVQIVVDKWGCKASPVEKQDKDA
jgi:hypothetical protein